MKRIEDENSKLTNQVKQIQTQLKSQAIQVNNLNNKLKEAEEKLIRWGFKFLIINVLFINYFWRKKN